MKDVKKDAFRISKVNSKIEHELGPILLEQMQGFEGLVTISKVETSGDMKWAKVWISIFGGDDNKILKHLKDNIYDIQGSINRMFSSKVIPRLSFHLDTSPRHAQHIDELIRKIHSENEQE